VHDAVFGLVRRLDGVVQEIDEVALGVGPLGEDEDAALGPGGVLGLGIADAGIAVLAQPGEERADLGIGLAAGLLRLAAEVREEGAGFFGGAGELAALVAQLGVGVGLQGLVGGSVGFRIAAVVEKQLGRWGIRGDGPPCFSTDS
jgi:hypothetical protein